MFALDKTLVYTDQNQNPEHVIRVISDDVWTINDIQQEAIYEHLKRIVQSIGLGHTRFHDLRHTFAAISLQNGDDIKTVSENLGHATVAFTLDVYGHVTDKMRKDSADRMQAFISSL